MGKIILSLMLCSVLMVTACGAAETEESKIIAEEIVVEETTSAEEEYLDESESKNVQETDEEIIETTVEKEYARLEKASDFSEGLAWVKYEDAYGVEYIGLLDTTGEITAPNVKKSITSFGSDFSGGYAYINYEDGFDIIDKQGNVTASNPEGEGFSVVAAGDGVFFVMQKVRTFDTNEDRYGFMDAMGNWLFDLTPDLVVPSSDVGAHGLIYSYHGEHIFSIQFDGRFPYRDYYLFNVDTGVKWKYEDCIPLKYFNGKTILQTREEYSVMEDNGEISYSFPKSDYGDFGAVYSEGLLFTGELDYESRGAGYGIIQSGKFYDIEGNIVIDLSQYALVSREAEGFYSFKEGVAPIMLLGADYCPYITFINRTGEFIFEPIKLVEYSTTVGNGAYCDDAICVTVEDGGSNVDKILKSDGTMSELSVNFTGNDFAEAVFCDGYAWNDEYKCFVSIEGHILATYIVK